MGGVILGSSCGTRGAVVGLVVAVGLGVAACHTPDVDELDLAANPVLCPDTGYEARFPGDRSVWVAPVSDARGEQPAPAADGPYPIQWMPETVWPRAMADMVEDVLRRELGASGVFSEVAGGESPPTDAVVVRTRLIEGRAGREERVGGRRTLARFSIRVVAQGPARVDGSRDVIYDEVHDRDASTAAAFQPARVPVIYGGAVASTVAEVLVGLERAGVGRWAGPPVEADATPKADGFDWDRDDGSR